MSLPIVSIAENKPSAYFLPHAQASRVRPGHSNQLHIPQPPTTPKFRRLNRRGCPKRSNFLGIPRKSALNLICAFLMEFEKNVYTHPVTSFLAVQNELDILLEQSG